ncbi:hypothetical protein [Streptomyces violascens]
MPSLVDTQRLRTKQQQEAPKKALVAQCRKENECKRLAKRCDGLAFQ